MLSKKGIPIKHLYSWKCNTCLSWLFRLQYLPRISLSSAFSKCFCMVASTTPYLDSCYPPVGYINLLKLCMKAIHRTPTLQKFLIFPSLVLYFCYSLFL